MLLLHTTLGDYVKLTTDLIMRWRNIPNFPLTIKALFLNVSLNYKIEGAMM